MSIKPRIALLAIGITAPAVFALCVAAGNVAGSLVAAATSAVCSIVTSGMAYRR